MRTKQLILSLAAVAALIQTASSSKLHAAAEPNIVIIFIDDMGCGDIGPFSATRETPHLDRMAKEGMKLTDFYVSSSACTPSRAALMTGCYADRIGMGASVVFPADERGLNPSEITIAEILKEGGYATGCFGKWHLGDQPEFLPTQQGFDEYEGIPYSNDMWVKGNPKRDYPPLPWMGHDKPVAHISDEASQAVITDAITDAAVGFVKRHRDEPFFCYVPHSAVHYPFMVTPERLAAAGDDVMTALISEVDHSTGRILQTLRDLGIAENTFVLFTNDNGGGGKTSPGPLRRGAKFGPKYEGHMRVATLAWWPGKIPAGSVSSEIMTTTDILPTVAKLTGQSVPTDHVIDGRDVSDILLGKPNAKSPHETLYYENDGIRQGRWKLVHYRIKTDCFTELYDLEADIGERNNVADQHPDRVEAMKAALDAHVAEIEKNSRPAAFVENPKPLLSDASGLPTLAEYVGQAERNALASGQAAKRVVHKTLAASAVGSQENCPDILFIAIDDMNDWTTLFDENNPIQTPNLERLAARGMFFDRAYCASPGCNPSRTAIMTGLRPTTSGVYSNGQAWREKIPDAISLPEYLATHGDYTTRGAGKIYHHGGTGAEPKGRPSFQEFFRKLPIRGPGKNKNYNGYRIEDKTPLASLAFDWGVHDQKMIDVDMCEWVEARMEEEDLSPLFLAAGIFNPHLPFYADAATFERYPTGKVKLPPMPADDMEDAGEVGIRMSDKEAFVYDQTTAADPDSPKSLHRMVQCYQAAADYADQMVGRLLDKLEATGRADDAIIVLWSDHGYHLGDKQCCVKFTLWEKANHVPFIIVAPGVAKPGSVCSTPVSLVDIYPTLVELAGLPPKADNDGISLVPLLKDPNAPWTRPALMTEGPGNHAIRSRDFRYIRYHNGAEELYADDDPWNHNNLAGDQRYADVLVQHRRHLPETEAPGIPARHQTIDDGAWKSGFGKQARPIQTYRPAIQPSVETPAAPTADSADATNRVYEPLPDDLLIADFEDGNGDWIATGTAFDPGVRRNRVTGIRGRGCINTFLDSDKSLGTLTSPPFKVERKHLNFLIGGGNRPGVTGLVLLVDGEAVRTATGFSRKDDRNQEIVDWKSWDVSPFVGKEATLQIIDQHSGGWGHIVVDHIIQSDRPATSALAMKSASSSPKSVAPNPPPSREIETTGKHLLLPIAPRKAPDGKENIGNSFRVVVDGVLVHQFWATVARREEDIEFWSYLDMSGFVGKTATVMLVRGVREGADQALQTFESSDEVRSLKPLYTETGRPQFHFSQKVGWNNDVNGMVYSDGLYHLAWQCNPVGKAWNNMYWGHAVSRDLVHWDEWPRMIRVGGAVAKGQPIHPSMSLGPAFSGSACVDHDNTLGRQVGDTKTLIACFTDVGGGDQSQGENGEKFVGESLAYSTDNGRTYHLLRDFNPIISHRGRDPRIFWYEPGQHWCIVTYRAAKKIEKGKPPTGRMAFYTSQDLKDWTFASFSDEVFHECPDFVELPVDGDPDNRRWMLFDATPKYQIGTFDGKQFTPEFEGTRQTIGGALKAAQCFSNGPDGRAICMVWARVKPQDPQAPYNQGFTLPLELSLCTATDGIRCYANPVEELATLRQGELASVENRPVEGETRIPLAKPETLLEIELTFRFEDGKCPDRVALQIGENWVTYDIAQRTFPDARLTSYDKQDGKLDLRVFVDNATVEVFGEHGAVYYLQPRRVQGESVKELLVKVEGGAASIENMKVHKLKSIWPDDVDTVICPEPR